VASAEPVRPYRYSRDVKLDDSTLREVLTTIHASWLAPADAEAIVDVARFAASVDARMDISELSAIARLARIVYTMSDQAAPPVPSAPVPEDWMQEVHKKLTAPSTRELAFAAAYLVVLADGTVGADEGAFGGTLSAALRIAPARAKELTELVGRALQD
jgi:hypothetical protein